MFESKFTWLAILTLVILFFVEILTPYDVLNRRVALGITAIGTIIGFTALYQLFKKRFGIIIPSLVAWVVAGGIWLDAIGNFAHFYTKLGWWDDLAHFGGTVSVAVFVFVAAVKLREKGFLKMGVFAQGIFSVGVSMLLSSFYEITELWGDYLFKMTRIGARWDTASDLQMDLLGSLLVVLIGTKIIEKKNNKK